MKRIATLSLLALCLPIGAAYAGDNDFRARLKGFNEVPSISTPASGQFKALIGSGGVIHFQLSYALQGAPTQAHIHFGQRHTNGGVSAFLCSNLGTPGVQPCPAAPATITGMITPANVIGPEGQGISPGQFGELVTAIRKEATYVNVHTVTFPSGEIRGQVQPAP